MGNLNRNTERWIKENSVSRKHLAVITPDIAAAMLEGNIDNYRARNQAAVDRFAGDMESGDWKESGDTVKFFSDGRLADGQHRLMACVQSQKPFKALIFWGVDTDEIIDTGRNRRFQDVLKKRGEDHHVILAGLARGGVRFKVADTLLTGGGIVPSTHQMLAFIEDHPDIRQSAKVAFEHPLKGLGGASTFGIVHFLMAKADKEKADGFFEDMLEDSGAEKGNPARTFRELIVAQGLKRAGVTAGYVRATMIIAANAYFEDRELHKIIYRRFGKNAIEFPTPSFISPEDL